MSVGAPSIKMFTKKKEKIVHKIFNHVRSALLLPESYRICTINVII